MVCKICWIFCLMDTIASFAPNNCQGCQAATTCQSNLPGNISGSASFCRICQFDGLEHSTMPYFFYQLHKYKLVFKECSLFQLVNISVISTQQPFNLLCPAHLNCSLFRIVMNIILYQKSFKKYMTLADMLDSNYSIYHLCAVKFELDWIVAIIKSITTATAFSDPSPIIIIDRIPILASDNLDFGWITTHVFDHLPEFCLNYIISSLGNLDFEQCDSTSGSPTIESVSLRVLLDNPYFFYTECKGKLREISKEYKSVKGKAKISHELDSILSEMYETSNIILLEKDVLKIILLILITKKQNIFTPVKYGESLYELLIIFDHEPTSNIWKELIYRLITTNTTNYIVPSTTQPSFFGRMQIHSFKNKEMAIQIIIFWITKQILHGPFDHIISLCCILFYNNLAKHYSIWMALHYSLLSTWNSSRRLKSFSKMKFLCSLPFEKFVEHVSDSYIFVHQLHIKCNIYPWCDAIILKRVRHLLISIFKEIADIPTTD